MVGVQGLGLQLNINGFRVEKELHITTNTCLFRTEIPMLTWYESTPKIGIFIHREDAEQWAIFNGFSERLGQDGRYLMVPFIGPNAQSLIERYSHPLVGLCGDLSSLKWRASFSKKIKHTVSWSAKRVAEREVLVSSHELGRFGARNLIQLGLTNLGLVIERPFSSHIDLEQGFRETVERAAGTCFVWKISQEEDYSKLLSEVPKPIGLLGSGDWVSSKVLRYAHDANVSIPREMAVLGIGNNPIACAISGPGTLSSIPLPLHEQGIRVAEVMLSLADGNPPPPSSCLVPPKGIFHRASTDNVYFADEHVRAAIVFLKTAFSGRNCLNEMHRKAGIGRRSLERRFKLSLNSSPRQVLEDLRIDAAKGLLTGPEHKIEYIARCCGFESGWALNRVFKRRLGIPPSKYRLP
jgi:AraC-like DNA-binding protein